MSTRKLLSWWESIRQTGNQEWRPGANHYWPYRSAGGHGCWLLTEKGGHDIWSTSDIAFDRKYWLANGYRHPLKWSEA